MRTFHDNIIIVSNYYEDSISIVDVHIGKELRKINLRKETPLYSSTQQLGPHHIAVDSNLKYLYVANTYQNSLAVYDLITGKLKDVVYVGSFPSQVILCKKYNSIYVANSDSNSISVVQMDNLKVILQIPTGQQPHGMVLSRDQERLFVANQVSSTITEINTSANVKKKCHSINGNPWHLRLSNDGKSLYVVNYCHKEMRKGKIFIFDTEKMQLKKTIRVGKMPVEVAPDIMNEFIYISDSDMNCLHIYHLPQDKLVKSVALKKMPHGVEVNNEKKHIYVTSIYNNLIHVIDMKSKAVKKNISVGVEPTSIVVL